MVSKGLKLSKCFFYGASFSNSLQVLISPSIYLFSNLFQWLRHWLLSSQTSRRGHSVVKWHLSKGHLLCPIFYTYCTVTSNEVHLWIIKGTSMSPKVPHDSVQYLYLFSACVVSQMTSTTSLEAASSASTHSRTLPSPSNALLAMTPLSLSLSALYLSLVSVYILPYYWKPGT